MKKILLLNILLLLISPAFSDPPQNLKPWVYSRTISDIKIFHRDGTDNGIFEFLAITKINRSSEHIAKIISDIPSNRFWMADCIHSELLAQISSNEVIAYYITSPPWPLSIRDTVVRIKITRESGITIFTISSIPEGDAEKYKPADPDNVRIYAMSSRVTLEETIPGWTEVRFSVAGESGGNVPDFMVRLGGWTIPYKTLSGIQKFLTSKE